MKAQLTNWMDN